MKNGLETRQSQRTSVLSSIITWVVSMLELAKNNCTRLLWLAKTVWKEAGVIQIWFSHMPWKEDRAHADKENMYKNIQQYLFMGFPDQYF